MKSEIDTVTILDGIKRAAENQVEGYKCHFIFAGNAYWYDITLRPVISKGMTKYSINSAMVSVLSSARSYIITKKEVENHCKGNDDFSKLSVNDDLESLFEDIRLGKEPDDEVQTYFLPKLTKEELKLVEIKDASYLETFQFQNPDVSEAEMKLSESDSKFVRGLGWRKTITIKNPSSQKILRNCSLQ